MIGSAAGSLGGHARDGRGMWFRTAVLALGLSLLGDSSAGADLLAIPPDSGGGGPDTSVVAVETPGAAADTLAQPGPAVGGLVPIDLGLLGGGRPRQGESPALSLVYPSFVKSYRHSMWREVQGNRFESGLVWADRGAFAGAALGFLGAQTAVTSERTALLLMGVGAALGALWGGLQPAEDRGLRIRVEPMRWEPAEMLRYDPREREP